MSDTDDEYVFDLDKYTFLVVLGGFVCFSMAWGIGANDVANAFATSVGSRAITLRQATVIAAIFEFAGAFLLGSSVTDTIRKGITNYEDFEEEPEILLLGMFCALCCSSLWLYIATKYSMPVSTTQSIVGSILGFALVAKGFNAVSWDSVILIVIFWVASPVGSALFALVLFVPTRNLILRREDSYEIMLKIWPAYVWIVIFIMTLFLLKKGLNKFQLDVEWGTAVWVASLCGLVIAIFAWLIAVRSGRLEKYVQEKTESDKKWDDKREEIFRRFSLQQNAATTTNNNTTGDGDNGQTAKKSQLSPKGHHVPQNSSEDPSYNGGSSEAEIQDTVSNRIEAVDEDGDGAGDTGDNYVLMTENGDKQNQPKTVSNTIPQPEAETETETEQTAKPGRLQKMITQSKTQMSKGVNVDVHDDLEKYELQIQANSERFDAKTEASFNWLQVVSASLDILAHGSNDVANAVAPFAAMIGIIDSGSVVDEVKIPWWVSFIGATGMVVGLATYGYKIIKAIGVRLVSMSSSRGYCIELASALMVIIASDQGFPASTTHCQIGATVGVGCLEASRNDSGLNLKTIVNWKLLSIVFAGWIFTVAVSALTCALLFAFIANTPSMQCNA